MPACSARDIDALLPQTQCGLCGYGGCMPYAEALSKRQAAINLCPPGGVDVLLQLGVLLGVDPAPYVPEMVSKAKPAVAAVIREDECIGCVKCIAACPVDAIIGSARNMHTVIAGECTGCELCIAPCPVDCIDLIEVPNKDVMQMADAARMRFNARTERLQSFEKNVRVHKRIAEESIETKKFYIQEAVTRALKKKQSLV